MATPVSCKAGLARLLGGFAPFGAVVAANGANGSLRPFGKAAITAAGVGRAVKRGSFAGGCCKGGRGALIELFENGGATADLANLPSAAAQAERLLNTACALELEPGFTVQWFAVRLEP